MDNGRLCWNLELIHKRQLVGHPIESNPNREIIETSRQLLGKHWTCGHFSHRKENHSINWIAEITWCYPKRFFSVIT